MKALRLRYRQLWAAYLKAKSPAVRARIAHEAFEIHCRICRGGRQ